MSKGDLLHIGTAYVEVHTFKGKDYVTVRDFSNTTNALSKEILELREENEKLKDEVEVWENANKILRMHDAKMEYENKELKKEREMLIEDLSSDKELYQQIVQKQRDYYEENQKLNIKVASLEGEIKGLNYTIEKLREELSAYDREYFDEDKKAKDIYKEQYQHSLGGDDELIYEEGLYD